MVNVAVVMQVEPSVRWLSEDTCTKCGVVPLASTCTMPTGCQNRI